MIDLFPSKLFVTECPTLTANHELVVDFLFLLHQPPPSDIETFSSFANYLWEKIVVKLGVKRGANIIRIIVDKPKYLPKPRDLLHVSRSTRTGKMNMGKCEVCDEGAIPHSSEYQQFLANAQLKQNFIHYLMDQFIQLSCNKRLPVQIVIDYEDLNCSLSIYNGGQTYLPMLQNNNGDAEYNVWYHCMMFTSQNIIIMGSDTDIWVGLPRMWLDKQ